MKKTLRARMAAGASALALAVAVVSAGQAPAYAQTAGSGTAYTQDFEDITGYAGGVTSVTKASVIPLLFLIGVVMALLGIYAASHKLVLRSLAAFLLSGVIITMAGKAQIKVNNFNTQPTASGGK